MDDLLLASDSKLGPSEQERPQSGNRPRRGRGLEIVICGSELRTFLGRRVAPGWPGVAKARDRLWEL